MRKIVLIALFALLIPNTWQNINSEIPKPMDIELISSDINKTEIRFTMDGFHLIPSGDPNSCADMASNPFGNGYNFGIHRQFCAISTAPGRATGDLQVFGAHPMKRTSDAGDAPILACRWPDRIRRRSQYPGSLPIRLRGSPVRPDRHTRR